MNWYKALYGAWKGTDYSGGPYFCDDIGWAIVDELENIYETKAANRQTDCYVDKVALDALDWEYEWQRETDAASTADAEGGAS